MAREMKDSGIEWIGEIPIEWKLVPIKYVASYNDETLGENTDLECEFDYIEIGSVEYGKGITQVEHLKFKDAPSRARRIVRKGDIIVSTVRTYLRAIANVQDSDHMQIASTGFVVIRAKAINHEYLRYSILSESFIGMVEAYSTGISYPAINSSVVVGFKIPIPNSQKQKEIAIFLNDKSRKLDNVLEKTRASIEEYKKLKQAVITQAVTKGIRDDREMKDSGYDIIGMTPYDWEVCKFGKCVAIKSNLVAPEKYMDYLQIAPDNIEKGAARLLNNIKTVKEVGVVSGNHLFHKGQIIYSKIRPMLNKLVIAPFDGLCSADMYPIETENDTEYIVFLMLSDLFLSQVGLVTMNRVKMPKINQSELINIRVSLPKIKEQREIAEYLKHKCTQLDEIIDKKELYLSEIENYKKSLIYEYVTGKKEVPQDYLT